MATLERPQATENSPSTAEAFIRDRQERAAKSASTVGEFREEWRRGISHMFFLKGAKGEGARAIEGWRSDIEKRDREIDEAAKGNESLRIDTLPNDTGGEALVGGGDAGIVLNRRNYASIGEAGTATKSARITAAHERTHAKQAKLHGQLFGEDGKPVSYLPLYEGDAEIGGNEGIGQDISSVREGQPEEVYGEGQKLMLRIIQKVGRDAVKKTMQEDGDLSRLQPAFSHSSSSLGS